MRAPKIVFAALSTAAVTSAIVAWPVTSRSSAALPGDAQFIDIDAAWAAATNGAPLDPSTLDCPSRTAQGLPCGDAGGGTVAGRAPDAGPAIVLPVVGMDPKIAPEVRRRAMAHQIFLGAVATLNPTLGADSGALDLRTLPGRLRASHLELLVADVLFFFEGDALGDKCLQYDRIVAEARFLGWEDSAAPTTQVASGWEALESSAKSTYGQLFSPQSTTKIVPDGVCNLLKPQTKGEEEQIARSAIDVRLLQRFVKEKDDTLNQVALLKQGFTQTLGSATLDVSGQTRATLDLRRAIESAVTNYTYATSDPLCLAQPKDGCVPLQNRIVDAGIAANAILDGGSPAAAYLDAAAQEETAHVAALKAIVLELRRFGGKDASVLSSASQAGLAACQALDENALPAPGEGAGPLPDGGASYFQRLDRCMSGVAAAYTELKGSATSSKEQVDFANNVKDLSTHYLDFNSN